MTSVAPQDATVIRCNGVDALSGRYLLPDLPAEVVGALARGDRPEPSVLRELKARHFSAGQPTFGVAAGLDPTSVAEVGWGAVFPTGAGQVLREALAPLLDHRRQQATALGAHYREFSGPDGARPDEASRDFLTRHGAAPGQPANPQRIPYYLLLVASPEEVPYSFQYQLDVTYAVGRVCFDKPEEYRRYAEAVVAAETSTRSPGTRQAAFFAARNPDDPATQLSADHLVAPLCERIAKRFTDWKVTSLVGDGQATKANLRALLGGAERPRLLITASHGVGFPAGHVLQRDHQGALLCQDWPGPRHGRGKPIPPESYFAGEDVPTNSEAANVIAFLFACYGLGTPQLDDFALQATGDPLTIAPQPFVGRLPQRLLAAGALAVVGHVDRTWSWSFMWPRSGEQLDVFESSLTLLMEGAPVGAAIEYFNNRYAALSTELDEARGDVLAGKVPDDPMLSGLWTAKNDARNYAVFGDPAVRLSC